MKELNKILKENGIVSRDFLIDQYNENKIESLLFWAKWSKRLLLFFMFILICMIVWKLILNK